MAVIRYIFERASRIFDCASRTLRWFKFKPAARYPADPRAVFILMLSVFTGLTTLALDVAPNSLEAILPHWGVTLWSLLLCVGSAITLGGMAKQTNDGVIAEQIGSVIVGVTTIFYSTLILYKAPSAAQSVGIILFWGLACFVRWGQLQALINESLHQAHVDKIVAEVQERLEGTES